MVSHQAENDFWGIAETTVQAKASLARAWIAVRRPLLVAFVLGCSVSLMTSGRVTLRLAGPATVYWSFVPLAGIAGLAAVSGRRLHAETIDEFFHGYLPWMLLIIAFAALWAFVPAPVAFARTGYPFVWEGLAMVALVSAKSPAPPPICGICNSP